MSVLKERLRAPCVCGLAPEAAKEIERLERELDRATRVPIDAILRLIEPHLEKPQEQ